MPTKPPSQNPSAGGACSRGGRPRGPWRLTRAEPSLGAPVFRALPRHGWHLAVISFSARALTMPGPCRGGTPPPGPPPRVGHRRRPGGGLPGRAGRPHAPPRGRLAEGQGASFRPGCVFLTDLAGARTGTQEPPEFTATAAGKGSWRTQRRGGRRETGGAGPDCGKPGQADTPNLAGLPRGPRDPYPVRLPRLLEFTHF